MVEPPEIKVLPEIVVNRIAAGEIIHRPASVVKELVENSLDAGATQINVMIGDGGLKCIQIQDNGCGIRFNDLEILCYRFTTSKLRQYEDLQTIATFGFRGEALASVSHVSHLTVITRCPNSQVAYKAEYLDGKLKEKPKPCAGNAGTILKIEDLFYNVPVRRTALKCARDEYARCIDVITKYALNNCSVAFSLKRQNESSIDIRTNQNSTFQENLATLFGAQVAQDVINFECKDGLLGYSANGYISHPNYIGKKFTFILFINERLVECSSLKKGLELLTSQILPKGNHSFIYINLKIKSQNVDVNVHPTKLEVHFLNESAILEQIQETVERKLLTCNDSRTFYVKQLKPSNDACLPKDESNESRNLNTPKTGSDKKNYDYDLIRTNFNDRKLEEFFTPKNFDRPQNVRVNFSDEKNENEEIFKNQASKNTSSNDLGPFLLNEDDEKMDVDDSPGRILEERSRDDIRLVYEKEVKNPSWRNLNLTSVRQLEQEIYQNQSNFLRSLIREHSIVGSIDARLTLIQYKTSLYLADTTKLCEQFFYQKIIFCFGNLAMFRFKKPFPLAELLRLALENREEKLSNNDSQVISCLCQLLTSKAEMLLDYFSLEIKDQKLMGIPILLDDFVPQLEQLPNFVLNLARNVDWSSELACFRSICREIAKFYAIKREFCLDSKISGVFEGSSGFSGPSIEWKWAVESLLYPNFKVKLFPQADSMKDGCLYKITDLHDLYKVFERC